MSMELEPYGGIDQMNHDWIEEIVLQLGDAFDIRISWEHQTALVTGVCSVAGLLLGRYVGGRMGATIGAGIGGVTGYGISTMVSLREIWAMVKDRLEELIYIVFNYLRQLDPIDYFNAFDILMSVTSSKRELALTMLEFIATKLGRDVVSNIITAA